MDAVKLRTEHMKNPIGLGCSNPFLSWICKNGVRQTAYEISASCKGWEVWNSGKVKTGDMHCLYGGQGESRQRIYWKVRLWESMTAAGHGASLRGLRPPF